MKATNGQARPIYERIRRIHHLIVSKKRWTAFTLAVELEVSDSTVRRDIDFMRDRLGFPLAYDPKLFTWRYVSKFQCPFCGKNNKHL